MKEAREDFQINQGQPPTSNIPFQQLWIVILARDWFIHLLNIQYFIFINIFNGKDTIPEENSFRWQSQLGHPTKKWSFRGEKLQMQITTIHPKSTFASFNK